MGPKGYRYRWTELLGRVFWALVEHKRLRVAKGKVLATGCGRGPEGVGQQYTHRSGGDNGAAADNREGERSRLGALVMDLALPSRCPRHRKGRNMACAASQVTALGLPDPPSVQSPMPLRPRSVNYFNSSFLFAVRRL